MKVYRHLLPTGVYVGVAWGDRLRVATADGKIHPNMKREATQYMKPHFLHQDVCHEMIDLFYAENHFVAINDCDTVLTFIHEGLPCLARHPPTSLRHLLFQVHDYDLTGDGNWDPSVENLASSRDFREALPVPGSKGAQLEHCLKTLGNRPNLDLGLVVALKCGRALRDKPYLLHSLLLNLGTLVYRMSEVGVCVRPKARKRHCYDASPEKDVKAGPGQRICGYLEEAEEEPGHKDLSHLFAVSQAEFQDRARQMTIYVSLETQQ